ncbi:hypothetical protein DVDV_2802 [Desulfovibrio sp. DV]|nr:hypothetical protein DVDV_2802 [Desulfovibrio sp. DV]
MRRCSRKWHGCNHQRSPDNNPSHSPPLCCDIAYSGHAVRPLLMPTPRQDSPWTAPGLENRMPSAETRPPPGPTGPGNRSARPLANDAPYSHDNFKQQDTALQALATMQRSQPNNRTIDAVTNEAICLTLRA